MDYGFIIRSVLLQLIVFCLIPFIYWLIRARKKSSFFKYIGMYAPQKATSVRMFIIFTIIYVVIYGIVHFTAISKITQPSADSFKGLGLMAVIPALLVSFIQQATAEEILFRGFIMKRLISRTGLFVGNIIQAAFFGSIHVLFSISDSRNLMAYAIIFTSTAAGGWLLGYLSEKLFNGSIIPSILLHGFGNFIMVLSVAF
ncbi:MAG: CPBP family intramembrane metalloprotease [Lachnospiraceae bacterium]|nr:CPBP family intramembrane metalloprotease [Lachnospiraceae bacterium]